jgi:hypothetical protein
MSLKAILKAGKELLKARKPSATPTTGQQQKQITYTPKPSTTEQGQELAIREIRNPPVVLKKTNPLQMGDKVAPSFGSSTYDWVMRKGRGTYTADEWLDHLTLDANEVGAMIKLNPINRLRPIELGVNKGAQEAFDTATKNAKNTIRNLQDKYKGAGSGETKDRLDDLQYILKTEGPLTKSALRDLNDTAKRVSLDLPVDERKALNKAIGEINNKAGPIQTSKTYYGGESNYTLQGGKDYRETIFTLPEEIVTNRSPFNTGGHFSDALGKNTNNIYHVRFDTRFTPDGKKVFMINEIQSDVNQSIAKSLSKSQQLSGEFRRNPFNADLELNLLVSQRGKMLKDLDDAIANNADFAQTGQINAIAKSIKDVNQKLASMTTRGGRGNEKDFFPMVEADSYGDHALKYLLQRAARENVDYVAVAPFDKLSFRQGYKAGNERFYGYANGKGIGKKGKAVMPDVMSKVARFYNTKAGPTKISLSDPSKPYKKVSNDTFKYPKDHPLKGKEIKSSYHSEVSDAAGSGYKNIPASDPRLYFDAFAIKVTPLMRNTQKTYKSKGGLVVDMFKPIRYN